MCCYEALPIEEQAWQLHKQQEGVPVCKETTAYFVQNFIYKLLFDKVGICGLLEFVVITCWRAQVLHCIVKGNILECTIVGFLPNFWWAISDKFAKFKCMGL